MINTPVKNQARPSRRGSRPMWISRLVDGVQRRFRRARPGSVLILVVALLVLLALIGTAFITTTGTDRTSAAQNVANTEADMLVQGVLDLMRDQIVIKVAPIDIVSGKSSYRPAVLNSTPVVANPKVPLYFSNVEYTAWDSYLASRYPSPKDTSVTAGPYWQFISANPKAKSRDINNPNLFPNQFVSPLNGISYGSRFRLQPTSVSVTVAGVTRIYPAFIIRDAADPSVGKTVLAADTDGDGIADAGLFELPIGQINGVRYYAAVRVVDNAAAINAAIAWEPVPNTTAMANMTPVNIALRRILDATDPPAATNPFNDFNTKRFGGVATANLSALRDDGSSANFNFQQQYDALWTMLGSRLDNPGPNTGTTTKYSALGIGDSVAMAYHGGVPNQLMRSSALEQYFPNATRGVYPVPYQPFAANAVAAWFSTIYDYDVLTTTNGDKKTPIRPMVTTYNPVTNETPGFNGVVPANEVERAGQYQFRGTWAGGMLYHIGEWVWFNGRSYVCCQNHVSATPPFNTGANSLNYAMWDEAPWHSNPVKINANTAGFGSLMAAYYAVMGDGPETKIPGTTQDPAYGGQVIWTFGNSLRNGGVLSPTKMKQLRAALAAMSTIDLRDWDNDVSSRTVMLTEADGSGGVQAQVFGTERQPYISESLAQINSEMQPYVVIELFNPYPTPIKLDAFRLATRDRQSGAITPIGALLSGQTITGFGYLYIQSSADAVKKPTDVTFPTGSVVRTEPDLEKLITQQGTQELQLLRTRRYDAKPTSSGNPANTFAENVDNCVDLVPADQLDFSGIATGRNLSTEPPASADAPIPATDRYHYRRATANSGVNTNPWHCVYGGPYNPTINADGTQRRQWGWIRDKLTPRGAPTPFYTGAGFGSKQSIANDSLIPRNGTTPTTLTSVLVKSATYRTRSMQVNNEGMPGPWKPLSTGAGTPMFPCGGFARTGDLLDVVFSGPYVVRGLGGFDEMNAISIDSAYAEDGDMNDDVQTSAGNRAPLEQLGRFCPLYAVINDLATNTKPNAAAPIADQRYSWARDLFDYFTVLCPQDDYLPNVDPTTNGDPTVPPDPNLNSLKWPSGSPQAVANGLAVTDYKKANHGAEDAAAVHGLINVNTANWRVMAALPFTDNPGFNGTIAKAIVTYRDANGPFRNLFDLLKVASFVTGNGSWNASGVNPGIGNGDISPFPGNTTNLADNVTGDYEARYLALKRISNMVTFRSDCFTAYVLVQGWRNPGTTAPELVVQRRAAMILDRSSVKPTLPGIVPAPAPVDLPVSAPTVTTVPNN